MDLASLPPWTAPALVALSVASGLGLLVAALALPRVLADLPVDWLETPEEPVSWPGPWLARAALASALGLAGLAMLVLPGQGVLTLIAAFVVSPLRGKKRVVRWALASDLLLRAVDALRARRGAPPLQRPDQL